jgi:hypothetical protein
MPSYDHYLLSYLLHYFVFAKPMVAISYSISQVCTTVHDSFPLPMCSTLGLLPWNDSNLDCLSNLYKIRAVGTIPGAFLNNRTGPGKCLTFFSTTAKPNFITRKQRNYKSLKTINAIVNAVLAKEQPTWSEHRGFKPKDRTELTYHTKGLAANQTSPRSLTNRTEHCDLLHAFQGKAAVQKTDRTLTVSHKETLNMLLPQTIAIRLSQPSICT